MKRFTKIIAVTIVLTGISLMSFSQQGIKVNWQKSFGGSGSEDLMTGSSPFVSLPNGGILAAGTSSSNDGDASGNHGGSDVWLSRTDLNGNLQWTKSLGGSNFDAACTAQQTGGGYLVLASTLSSDGDVSSNHGSYDFWAVKLDANRNIQWQKTLGGSGVDIAHSLLQVTFGNYTIVAGETYSTDGNVSGNHGGSDAWIAKLDFNGNLISQKCFGGSDDDAAYSIRSTSDGGYILAGYTDSNDGDVSGNHNSGSPDYWVVKLDANFNIDWQKCLGGSDFDYAQSAIQTSDGGYAVTGYVTSSDGDVTGNHNLPGDASAECWTVRLDANGNTLWEKAIGGTGNDYGSSIEQGNDGGYTIGGVTDSNDGDVTGNHGGEDSWILRLDASGNLTMQQCFGGSGTDRGYNVHRFSDGVYYMTGSSSSTDGEVTGNHGSSDFWLAQVSDCYATTQIFLPTSLTACKGSPTQLSLAGGGGESSVINWYVGGCGPENGGTLVASGWYTTLTTDTTATFYVRGEGVCPIPAPCISTTITINDAPGDTAVFGDHVWNVYAFNGGGATANADSWHKNYAGYTVVNDPNFFSYQYVSSPINFSPGYQGCPVSPYNNSWSAKRRGFDCGTYQISLFNTSDEGQLFINGILVYDGSGYNYNPVVWTGTLNDTSTMVLRVTKGSDGGQTIASLFNQLLSKPSLASGPIEICPGYSIPLTASGGTSYLWNTGSTDSTITVDSSATYSVTVTLDGGCSKTFSRTIAVQPLATPIPTVYGMNPYFSCNGVPQLGISNFSAANTYHWSDGLTGNVITPEGPGDYTVYSGDELGCVSDTSSPLTLSEISSGDSTIYGDHQWRVHVISDYSAGYWVYLGNGDYNYVSQTGNYYAGYFDDTVLNFNSIDHWSVSGNPTQSMGYSGCNVADNHFHFDAERQGFDCGIYQIDIPSYDDQADLYVDGVKVWEQGCCGPYINAWTGLLNEDSKVKFQVYEFTGSNVGSIQFMKLQSFTPVTAVISGPTEICLSNSILLDAGSGFSSYEWSTGSDVQTTSVTGAGNYSVKVTDSNGCISTSQTSINSLPSYIYFEDADNDHFGNTNASIEVCTSAPGGYVTDSTDCDDTKLDVHPGAAEVCNSLDDNCNSLTDENSLSALVDAGGSTTLCPGFSVNLLASASGAGFFNYQWYDGSNPLSGATNSAYAAFTSGNYSVVVSSGICSGTSNNVTTTSVPRPSATVTPSGTVSYCKNITVPLNANTDAGYIFQWYKGPASISGATNATFNSAGSQQGYYSVLVTDANGCHDHSDSTHLIRLNVPPAVTTVVNPAGNPDLCVNGSVRLRGTGGPNLTYLWYKNNISTGVTTRDYVVTVTGSYSVKITNANNCSRTSMPVSVISSCRDDNGSVLNAEAVLNVYPNPSDGHFNVKLILTQSFTGNATVEILNMIGQVVQSQTVPMTDGMLFTELWLGKEVAAANYMMRIVADDQVFKEQVVLQH